MGDFFQKAFLSLPQWLREHLLPLILTIRVGGFLLSAFALWGFANLAGGILDKETFAFDQEILLALRELQTPFLDELMIGITFFGDPNVLGVVSLIIALVLVYRRSFSEATVLIIANLGAVLLNLWLKDLFARDRPELWERVVDVQLYSFPSGHAMIALVVYSVLAYLLVKTFPNWRWLIITVTIPLILGIGLSRLYLGVHWPSDVLAGYAAGLVWLLTCIFSLELWQARQGAVEV